MNRRFLNEPVKGTLVLADKAERIARDLRQMAAAVNEIADNLRIVQDVLSPLVERLKSKQVFPPAKASIGVSTKGGR